MVTGAAPPLTYFPQVRKKVNSKLTDVDVVFSQSHQGEEEDVPVHAPEEEEGGEMKRRPEPSRITD